MTVLQGGNVGIGTTSPAATLHVQGTTIAAQPVLIVADEKAAATNGGTCTAGSWSARTLNTVRTNTITGASVASDQITLPAGTYEIDATSPGYRTEAFKAKLVNITDTADVVIGTTGYSNSAAAQSPTSSRILGQFTIAASKTFQIQHRCSSTYASLGLGLAYDLGVVEVYTLVKITRIQ